MKIHFTTNERALRAPGLLRTDGARRVGRLRKALAPLAAAAVIAAGLVVTPVAALSASAVTPNGVGTYDSSSAAPSYTGPWSTMTSGSDIGGSSQYLNNSGSVSFTFAGPAIQWISRQSASSGINDVYIDGTKVKSVDRYSATNKYKVPVFQTSTLTDATHTIVVKWTGRKNTSSTGTNVLVDAFIVPDTTAPSTPTGLTGVPYKTGVDLTWDPVSSSDLAGYVVYRASVGYSTFTQLGTVAAGTEEFHDVGLSANTQFQYKIGAVDTAGNVSPLTPVQLFTSDGPIPTSQYRYDNCPAATVTVSTSAQFQAAMDAATPGTVIKLSPGTYRSIQFTMSKSGTTGRPIWICGPRTAILDAGTQSQYHDLFLDSVSNVVVTGFTVQNALKGVTVKGGSFVTVSDMLVQNIGYEGIHLRQLNTDSDVIGNTIKNTGLLDPIYGEGIYIGSSQANWCSLTNCQPDTVDRSLIQDNVISATGAQSIEAKEGTTDGIIDGNTVKNTSDASGENELIMVKGNGYIVSDNTGKDSKNNGISTNASVDGWAEDNVFVKNTLTVNGPGYGIYIHLPASRPNLGNIVGCDNTVTAATLGKTNVTCQP